MAKLAESVLQDCSCKGCRGNVVAFFNQSLCLVSEIAEQFCGN